MIKPILLIVVFHACILHILSTTDSVMYYVRGKIIYHHIENQTKIWLKKNGLQRVGAVFLSSEIEI